MGWKEVPVVEKDRGSGQEKERRFLRQAKFLHVTPSGMLVAVAKSLPGTDLLVADSRGNVIGPVIDVFGPIAEPYLLIKPQKGSSVPESGSSLFLYRRSRVGSQDDLRQTHERSFGRPGGRQKDSSLRGLGPGRGRR